MIERTINLIWALVGLGTMINAWQLGLVGPMGPDSGLFPLICGIIITSCALLLLAYPNRNRATNPEWPRRAALFRVLGVIGGLMTMAITLPYLGFVISAAITTFVLLQTVERTRFIQSAVITLVSVAFVMYVFDHLLGMSLPRGPWGW